MKFTFALRLAVSVFVAITASLIAPTVQAETAEARALQKLQTKLSAEQIDEMMADESFAYIAYTQQSYPQFSQPSANPTMSQCRVNILGVSAGATGAKTNADLARITRQYCFRFINFQLDPRYAAKADLARDNFVCTIAAIDEGTADTVSSHREGFSGVIVEKKIFRSPKVTEIDNTHVVQERHAGRPSSISMQCLVSATGFQNGETLTGQREAWRSAQVEKLTEVVAKQRASVEAEARSKMVARDQVDQEVSRLTKTFLRLETQITSYNKCLDGYESFARKIRRVKIENESDNKECPILVIELKQKTNELTTDAKSATTAAQLSSTVNGLKQIGFREESVCARQITYCEAHRPK